MPNDPDPLLSFFAEPAALDPSERTEPVSRGGPVGPAETTEKSTQSVVTPRDPSIPGAASGDEDAYRTLSQRVARAERMLDRSLVEIAALRGDLATLVTTLDDIRKRPSRVETSPANAAPPAARTSRGRPLLAAVVLMAGVGLGWGVMSLASDDVPERPPIESAPEEPTARPAPVVDDAPPRVDLETPPSAAAVAAPTVVSPAVAAPVSTARPVRDPPARPLPRPDPVYVGTLTIDAIPDGEVFLNRKSVGRTPLRLESLRAGSHLIWIEREGYRRWTRVVAVAADRVSRVSATLDSLSR